MKKYIFFIATTILLISCKENKTSSEENNLEGTALQENTKMSESDFENLSVPEKIAYKNGYENWNKVEELDFTFNVDRGDTHSQRSWKWMPKTNDVVMMTEKDTLSYNRNNLNEESKKADAAFINDKYWLLAPYNLAWDTGTTFTETKNQEAPISKEKLNKLTVVYSNEGGYTPGDAYDFYYDNDFKIKEWNYRQSNSEEPSMSTTWEDYEDFGGLTISKTHKDATGGFKLYFTGISVK